MVADGTRIEWADATWNPVTGCSVISPGCANCYAMRLAGGRLRHHPSRAGLTMATKAGPVWTGGVTFNEDWLGQPLRWRRPRRIFVCAHGDLFHENVPYGWIERVFAVMALAPWHKFLVLTKRPERMREYCEPGGRDLPLHNVWLGVSVEDQTRADQRIPILLDTSAALRWVSAEPLLGPIDLGRLTTATGDPRHKFDALRGQWLLRGKGVDGSPDLTVRTETIAQRLDWVVAGGESGPAARPMNPDWARSLRDQCQTAGVPFFFKQWGSFAPARPELNYAEAEALAGGRDRVMWSNGETSIRLGKKRAGALLDGREWRECLQ